MKSAANWGLPLKITTGIYLLFSLFGCLFYVYLPPFLCSMGARIHAYLLIAAALEEEPAFWPIVLMVLSQLFILATVAIGVFALLKGSAKLYRRLVALEILLTLLFFLFQRGSAYEYTAGILFNIAYCIWLFLHARKTEPKAALCRSKK